MNLEQRISNLERNVSTPIPGYPTLGRLELVNTASTQSIPNLTTTIVGASATTTNQWSITENTGGLFTVGATTGLVTLPTTGRYSIYTKLLFDANTTGRRIVAIEIVGSNSIAQSSAAAVSNAGAAFGISVPSFRLTTGSQLRINVYQDSGAARTLLPSATNPLYFIVEYLGA